MTALILFAIVAVAAADDLAFDVVDNGAPSSEAPRIEPWKSVPLDPDYSGTWYVAGDLTGDGIPEIVAAENVNVVDTHYTSAVAAHGLDGTVLWRWGDPDAGRKELHHDVACQIYDWNADGKGEVVICTKDALVELEGATGKELRRWTIPEGASDCLVFCNLRGTPTAQDVLVKDRYSQIWAYGPDGTLLWTVRDPGGYRTAHQPCPVDIDHDGKDEIMAGYAMLNADGTVRWTYESKAVNQKRGHLDCMRVLKPGDAPEAFRLALTCCGANNLAVIDGTGAIQWEMPGHHFESIQVGNILPNRPAPQLLVDIDHQPSGAGPLWVVDAEGKVAGKIMTHYARQHRLLDWDGVPGEEIFNGDNRTIYSNQGRAIAVLPVGGIPHVGDMDGDGVPDLIIGNAQAVHVFRNEHGRKPDGAVPLGTGVNTTLY